MNVKRVKWKDKIKYLGNIFTKDMCDDADIRAKRVTFIGPVKRLNAQFRGVSDKIRIRLLQTYCTAWCGCQTIEWEKVVRRTLNLPRTTRSNSFPF